MIFDPSASDRKVRSFTMSPAFLDGFRGKQPNWGPLGYFVFKRTYARDLPEGGSEEWWQTCQRVVEGCFNIQKIHCRQMGLPWKDGMAQKSAQEMFQRMWDFKFTPPGRGLWVMGTDLVYSRGSAALNNCFAGDTEIITADGVKPIGSLAGTDQTLLTRGGAWVNAPILSFGKQKLWKLVIQRDNAEKVIYCTGDHRWFAKLPRRDFSEVLTRDLIPNDILPGHCLEGVHVKGAVHHKSHWTVKSVEETDRVEEVYCATVKDHGAFALEGNILTGNCAFVSTEDINEDFVAPFCFLMDMSMLGVGVGGDTRGAGKVKIQTPKLTSEPYVVEDSREGWVDLLKVVLNAFIGKGQFPSIIDYSKVRGRGAPIRTFGGVASGPKPLQLMVEGIVKVLLPKGVSAAWEVEWLEDQGKINMARVIFTGCGEPSKITSTQIVDIFNFVGKCVVSGGVRRCLPKGTLVHTELGLIPIEKVKVGMRVMASEGYSEVTDWVYQGVQPISRIKTSSGYFDCTDKHKIAIADGQGYRWVQAKDLKPGDRMIQNFTELEGSRSEGQGSLNASVMGTWQNWSLTKHRAAAQVTNKTAENNYNEFVETVSRALAACDPESILQGSLEIRSHYLKSVYDANGPDSNHIVESLDLNGIRSIQAVAASLGIPTRIVEEGEDQVYQLVLEGAFAEQQWRKQITAEKRIPKVVESDSQGTSEVIRVDHNVYSEETYDISVKAGEFVAQGGYLVHNTAEIMFGEPDDEEFLALKQDMEALNDRRWASNNSIFAKVGMDYSDIVQAVAKNGEPGLFWLENAKAYSRMIDQPDYKDRRISGANPCFAADTLIATADGRGAVSIKQLADEGQDIPVYSIDKDGNVQIKWGRNPRMTRQNAPLVEVVFEDGGSLRVTPDHKMYLSDCSGSLRVTPDHKMYVSHYSQCEAKDLRARDKVPKFSSGDIAKLDLLQEFEQQDSGMEKVSDDYVLKVCTVCGKVMVLPWQHRHQVGCSDSCFNRLQDVIQNHKRDPNPGIESKHVKEVRILEVTEDVYNLTVDDNYTVGVVTDFNPETLECQGVFTYQCMEQTLESWEMCNLVETYPAHHESEDDFNRTLKFAYLYAKTVTLVPTHDPRANAVMTRNRRIGCSMSGITQALKKFGRRKFLNMCDSGYKEVQAWDRVYSDWLGVPLSIKTTSVKPSGCRPGYALTSTSEGLLTLDELLREHPEDQTWNNAPADLHALDNKCRITKTFRNGKALINKITLSYGMVLESTLDHKWEVREDNHRYWVKTKDLKPGDVLTVTPGVYQNPRVIKLASVDGFSKSPKTMTPELAWSLGFLWAGNSGKRSSKTNPSSEIHNRLYANQILHDMFELQPDILDGLSDVEMINLFIHHFQEWLKVNDIRLGSDKTPLCVRASDRDIIIAFMAGVLDYMPDDVITLDDKHAYHIQDMCWAVGLCMDHEVDHDGNHLLSLTGVSDKDVHDTYLTYSVSKTIPPLSDLGLPEAVKVISNEPAGEVLTYDIEVDHVHWYYAGAVKSHNTVSLLCGATPGIHYPHSEYYMRWVRVANTSPLVQASKNAGHPVYDDPYADDTSVVGFPVHEANYLKGKADVTVWEQFANTVDMQKYWADNQVSVTITFRPDEIEDLKTCLEIFETDLKGLSMLPMGDEAEHGYKFPPYQTITKDDYESYMANILPLDLNTSTHDDEATEKFCSNDTCEVSFKS